MTSRGSTILFIYLPIISPLKPLSPYYSPTFHHMTLKLFDFSYCVSYPKKALLPLCAQEKLYCTQGPQSNRNSGKLEMKWNGLVATGSRLRKRSNIFITVFTAAECVKGWTERNPHSSSAVYSLYEVKVSLLFESVSSGNWEWFIIPTYRFKEQGVVVWFMLSHHLQCIG